MNWELIYVVLGGIGRLYSKLYGITIPFVNVLLTVTTVYDLAYICIPPIQYISYKAFNGKRFGGFRLLTRDLLNAYEEGTSTGKNVSLIYLRRRASFYLYVVGIYYVVLGAGPSIMLWFFSYARLLITGK